MADALTVEPTASDNASLSMDEAASFLDKRDEQQEAAPTATPATETPEAAPAVAETGEPAEVIPGEATETTEAAEPPIEPPKFWGADAKARFRELPRDVQEVISLNEQQSVTATAKKFEEAATARKAAEAEASKLATYTGHLDKLIPQAEATFKSRWEGVDWNKVTEEYGADQALKFRFQFEQEREQLQQLTAAKVAVEQNQFQQFVQEEAAKLPTLAPDLVDPKEGPARREALGKFLVDKGIPSDRIPYMTANEASIAYKAMLWDKAQAEAKAKVLSPGAPKPAVPQGKLSVRPTAAAQGTPKSARVQQLSQKRSMTIDEAVELMTLQESP